MASGRFFFFSPFLVLIIAASALLSALYIARTLDPKGEEGGAAAVAAPLDPAAEVLGEAARYIREQRVVAARDLLAHAVEHYPDSPSRDRIRRLLSRLNVDLLFTEDRIPGKSVHVAEEATPLVEVARALGSTVDYLMLANGKVVESVQAGEELLICTLRFEVSVQPEAGEVVVRQGGGFFASYPLRGHRLPSGVGLPFTSEVLRKVALVDGERVTESDPRYVAGVKCIEMTHHGVAFRPPPAGGEEVTGFFLDAGDLEELSIFLGPSARVGFGEEEPSES